MIIPVYVLTGFLDSGKTSFLNDFLEEKKNTLLISFERGEEDYSISDKECKILNFSKKYLENNREDISKKIFEYIKSVKGKVDEIWIEWNGTVPFSILQTVFSTSKLWDCCEIKKVIHIADTENIEYLMGRTGDALPEQVANSDIVILKNTDNEEKKKKVKKFIKEMNSGVGICEIDNVKNRENLDRKIYKNKIQPTNLFFISIAIFVLIYMVFKSPLENMNIPVNTISNIFIGIILQAIPFLLIGVLLSSIIQVFVPGDFIQRKMPKSLGLGILFAILSGFCLPVCDCASIPIFKSLVKKGIPLPVAVTFMTATPVINPVVILSTYYAFNGDLKIVLSRICLGIIAATIIGLFFQKQSKNERILKGDILYRYICGCYQDSQYIDENEGKLSLLLRHSQAEFFNVGKHLVIGSFVAACFQGIGTNIFIPEEGVGTAVHIVIMMVMAFVLSLCSSSDAIVARSLSNQFSMAGIMGFLVFGPMIDIKNVMMLSSGFSKKFITKLLIVSFVVCFVVVFIPYGLGEI